MTKSRAKRKTSFGYIDYRERKILGDVLVGILPIRFAENEGRFFCPAHPTAYLVFYPVGSRRCFSARSMSGLPTLAPMAPEGEFLGVIAGGGIEGGWPAKLCLAGFAPLSKF